MTIAMKRVIAALLAPIAIFGFALTAFTESAIADGTGQQGDSGNQALSTQETTISTDVRPWCGWTALAAAETAISLVPAVQGTVYDGTDIALAAIGQEFAIKVGPVRSTPVEAGESFLAESDDNCSWFRDDQKNGVAVTTTLSGNSFVGVSDANTGSATVVDASMNFEAEDNNAFTIANTADTDSCTGFSFTNSSLFVTSFATATAAASVVTLDAGKTSTNDFCSWKSDYSIKIPAGMTPLFGGSTYLFKGPTITNTMVYSREK
jgi:hypothetical protein